MTKGELFKLLEDVSDDVLITFESDDVNSYDVYILKDEKYRIYYDRDIKKYILPLVMTNIDNLIL